jgi:glycosyltransferase involved in cell wall biosynthesis
MRIAFLTTDNREQQKRYHLESPFFGPAPEAIIEGFKAIPDDIELHIVSCAKKRMPAPEKLAPNIYFHQPIVPHIGWGRTAFAGCALAVRKLLKKIQPDIVHGQGTERDCAISAVYSGFPNVITIHGNMQQIYRMRLLGANSYYWLASTLESHALGRTAGVFCNSRHTRSLVEARTHDTWLVPNPLRTEFFTSPTDKKHANVIPVFLVIGVVTPLKRPLEILQAMKSLHDAGHAFKVRFIGGHSPDSPYGSRFQKLLDEGIHKGYADYLGIMEIKKIIQCMDEADALIHFPEEEAFGLVVAEALSRNLKIFAARIGGIPDILEGVEGAELHEDFHSLKKGIATWLETGAREPGHGAGVVRSHYHPKVIGSRHLEIYREVLSEIP